MNTHATGTHALNTTTLAVTHGKKARFAAGHLFTMDDGRAVALRNSPFAGGPEFDLFDTDTRYSVALCDADELDAMIADGRLTREEN